MAPTLGDRLEHILGAIAGIQEMLSAKTMDGIATDKFLRLALERQLEIICEASRHVPPSVKAQGTAIDWVGMINLGNRLRHAYHLTDLDIVLDIAREDLPPLKAFVERVLAEERKS